MKMATASKLAATLVAIAIALTGCGGGGGGGDAGNTSVSSTTTTTLPPVAIQTCPNGSAAPATGAANCPTVTPNAPVTLSTVTPRLFKQGLTVQFNGALNPSSITSANVVLWKGAVGTGVKVAGNASLAINNKDLTYAAVQFLANGASYTLDINVTDSLGRPVHLSIPFTTTTMVCADNAIWSNPANFGAVYQDCIADIGVQTLVNKSFNTLQDNTCSINVSSPLTSECKAYMANGTMILANTSIVANGHSTIWMAYLGTDGVSNIVLMDTGNVNTPIPIGKMALPSDLVWIIGNPTGVSISITTSVNGVLRNEQITWNASSSTLTVTCVRNC